MSHGGGKPNMVNKIIGAILAIVIGVSLVGIVGTFANNLTVAPVTNTAGNVLTTGGQFYGTTVGSLIDLLPVLFVIILVAGVVGFIAMKRQNA
jgi:hypothetical protein